MSGDDECDDDASTTADTGVDSTRDAPTRVASDGGRFGRGRIRARKNVPDAAIMGDLGGVPGRTMRDVFRLDIVSHESRVRGVEAEDPPARYPPSVGEDATGEAVCDAKSSNVRAHNASHERMMRGAPVLLMNTGVLGDVSSRYVANRRPGLEQTWGFDRVAEALGPKQWSCAMCPSSKHKFVMCDDSKNAHGSYYHIREPEVEIMRCTFKDFTSCARGWKQKSILFESDVYQAPISNDARAPTTTAEPPLREYFVNCTGDFIQDLHSGINWEWFHKLRQSQRFGQLLSMKLVAGARDSLTPARYALEDSFQLQVSGRRRVLLISPEHSFKGMYPYPVAHPYDGYSMVDFDDVNYGQTPAFASVRGMSFVLCPGDILYVPRGWWRHEQGMSKEHITLDVRLAAGNRPRERQSAVLPVARRIEERLARAEGIARIKHWLKIIADAEDAQWIDLSTVKGHRRIVMAQMVRDEVDSNMGRGTWQAFLRAMIDGRLDPTPWLNISFREPLYLTDTPVQLPDTRNELEQEFPEFFIDKLQSEGYDVRPTPISVFNPNHPETICPKTA